MIRWGAICVACMVGLDAAGAMAQSEPAMERLRACSLLLATEKLECLEKLSQQIESESMPRPGPRRTPVESKATGSMGIDGWTFSETTSPVDYSPVAVAASWSDESRTMLLSIQCRGGRSELSIGGPAVVRAAPDYTMSYAVNEAPPVTVGVAPTASGSGVSMRGDIGRWLATLPEEGVITFRLMSRQGEAVAGRYGLTSLKRVRHHLSGPCKWS